MKKTLLCAALLTGLCASATHAATTAMAPAPAATPMAAATASAPPSTAGTTTMSPQNNRMKDCAAKYHAQGIAKSQYHTFMSGCLKNPTTATMPPAAPTPAPAATTMAPNTTSAPANRSAAPVAMPSPAGNIPQATVPNK